MGRHVGCSSVGMRWLLVFLAVSAISVSTSPAAARERSGWASVALDTAGLGSTTGAPRTDLAAYFLATPRYHLAMGSFAQLSLGVGLPVLQLIAVLGSKHGHAQDGLLGAGLTAPLTLWLHAEGHDHDSVVFSFGGNAVLTLATVCAFSGSCEGRKANALVGGVVGEIGLGYHWREGAFFRLAYENGRFGALGHAGGVPAIEGMYQGVGLTLGVAFGG